MSQKGIETAIKRIRKGFPWKDVKRTQDFFALKDEIFAHIIGISDRTLTRLRAKQEKLAPAASDRLYRMNRILDLATTVFEDRKQAKLWLSRPQPGLDNSIPIDILDTEPGVKAVENLLGQIEYSVLP